MSAKRRFAAVVVAAATATSIATAPAMAAEGSSEVLGTLTGSVSDINGNLIEGSQTAGSGDDRLAALGSISGSLGAGTASSLANTEAVSSLNEAIFGDAKGQAAALSTQLGTLAGLVLPVIAIGAAVAAGVQWAQQQGFIR